MENITKLKKSKYFQSKAAALETPHYITVLLAVVLVEACLLANFIAKIRYSNLMYLAKIRRLIIVTI